MANFTANESGGERIDAIAPERFHNAIAKRDIEAATVRTVERTGTADDFES
jgi:hypothetical protein